MKQQRARPLPPALLSLLVLAACGGGRMAASPETASPSNLSAAEIEALYEARQDSARMRFSEADVRFMQGMIHHHAQAIEMGRLAPTHGGSSSIQTLAARIINAQRDEIALMQTWLRDREQPVPDVHITDTHVRVMDAAGRAHEMHMPGMLTEAQMQELAAARDETFDRLFLTYMIQHHRGAVTMVHELFAAGGAGQDEAAFKLASDVQADQSSEIARMERMLERMSGR